MADTHIPDVDPTLHLPRILCLHGGGTNARIFNAQCRAIKARLRPRFRLCFADAPFMCDSAGPDVTMIYQDYAPFKRWMRWLPEHPEIDSETEIKLINIAIDTAMQEDDRRGATGEWVGLLGFSQGSRICASLLYTQQIRNDINSDGRYTKPDYKFAVLMAGRGPLVVLDVELARSQHRQPQNCDSGGPSNENTSIGETLYLPTVHVHGRKDPGLGFHQNFLEDSCTRGTTRLIEWDGEHRIPIKPSDVTLVVESILAIAKETGILKD